jgi:hypothetical protein
MKVNSGSIFGKADVTYFKRVLECRICIETGEKHEIPQSGKLTSVQDSDHEYLE